MRVTGGIGSSTENLAGIVNSDGIGDDESGAGGRYCIEINQRAVTVDEADVLAGQKRVVALNRKDCCTDNLARCVDPGSGGSRSPRERAQVGPATIAVLSRV